MRYFLKAAVVLTAISLCGGAARAQEPSPAAIPLAPVAAPAPVAAAPAPAADAGVDPLAWGEDNKTPSPGAAPAPASPVAAVPASPPASLSTTPADSVPMPALPVADKSDAVKELEERLKAAEEKADALERRLSTAEEAISKFEKAVVEKPVQSVVKKAAPKKKRPAAARRKAPSAPATHWVLKSAKPGMAWVAEPGSNDMQAVSVGETLSGIGRVTSVLKDSSGHWVVNGTKGRISQ